MIKKIISLLFKDILLFSAAYSNNVFPDPLTHEEEEKYIKDAQNGDKEARNKLIEHNLRLIAHIVKKYEHTTNEADDLISIGTIGLIKGIDSFSNKKDTKLTTYCARCIENEILMYFRSNKKNKKNISLNESIGFDKEGNEITFLDILKTPDPEYALNIHTENNLKDLQKYLNILSSREKEIIEKRYGLNSYDETTQKDIAKMLNVQRPAYTQYENEYTTIPLIHLNTICNFLDISLDYVFEFTENKNYNNYSKDIDKILAGKRLKEWRKSNKITQEKLALFTKKRK